MRFISIDDIILLPVFLSLPNTAGNLAETYYTGLTFEVRILLYSRKVALGKLI